LQVVLVVVVVASVTTQINTLVELALRAKETTVEQQSAATGEPLVVVVPPSLVLPEQTPKPVPVVQVQLRP
jgi:hypothetical protein